VAICAVAVTRVAAGAPESPDVAVLRDDLALHESTLLASVRNTGSVLLVGVSLGATVGPPEPSGVERHGRHSLTPGIERGWALWAERLDPTLVRLHVAGCGDRPGLRAGGEMQITGAGTCEVAGQDFETPDLLSASADGAFSWQNQFEAGDVDGFAVDLAVDTGQDPFVRFTAHIDGLYRADGVWLGIQRAFVLPARIRLSRLLGDPSHPPMVRTRIETPLAPGETRRVAIGLPPAMANAGRDVYVVVDPDDELHEVREGNNIARLKVSPEVQACQFHLHSSLGGADGSLDNQLYHAAACGTDAVFVTDDDWRVSLFSYCTGFDLQFPDLSTTVNVGSESFVQRLVEARESSALTVERVMEPYPGRPGERFLMLRYSVATDPLAPAGDAYEYRLRWEAARRRLAYPLSAGVHLECELLRPSAPADVAFVVRVALSTQCGGGRDALTYVVGDSEELAGGVAASATGPVIPLSWPAQDWGRVSFDLSADAERYLVHGPDNAISSISFGLRARSGEGDLGIDGLAIHTEHSGEWLVEQQRAAMAAYPNLAVFVSPATSYYPPRFGIIGPEALALDYEHIDPAGYASQVVELAHRRNDLVVFQYPAEPEATLANGVPGDLALRRWAREGLYGADLFEAGYRPGVGRTLEPRLELVDQCLRDGVFIVGVGVSGADGETLSRTESNFLTWVYAHSTDLPSIMSGLRAGRAFFGDPLGFAGRLDLTTPEGFAMGDIVLTTNTEHVVRAVFRGLPPDSEVALLVNGERRESSPLVDEAGNAVVQATVKVAERGSVVRTQATDVEGLPIAVSNPIVFLPQRPRGPRLPADRGGVVLEDLVVRDIEGFAVSDVRIEEGALLVQGVGANGTLTLSFGARGMPRDVRRISDYGVATEVPCEWLENGARVAGISGPCTVQVRWKTATRGQDDDGRANGDG